jgi:hypothetical protein
MRVYDTPLTRDYVGIIPEKNGSPRGALGCLSFDSHITQFPQKSKLYGAEKGQFAVIATQIVKIG